MASGDRALNYAVRVKGQQEATTAFRAIGQAATQSISAVAAASQAAAAHDEALARATDSAAAFGAAQAAIAQRIADAKAAFAAGKMGAEEYQLSITAAKNELSLFKAENQSAARQVDATARSLVSAQQAAAAYARQATAAASVPAAATAIPVDQRSGAQRLIAGDASVDRAAISATTLEQVLGRVATKSQIVSAAMRDAAAAEDEQAVAADRLRARYNPLYATLSAYLATKRDIRQAEAAGVLTTDEATAAIARERQATLAAVTAIKQQEGAVVGAHGRMGASGMILQHVVRSTADSFAAGLPPSMIFAEQIGRIGEAAALSGGALGKFGAFMAGPWGIAITAAGSLLGLFIGKILDTSHSIDGLVKKLKEDAEETRKADEARRIFKGTTEGLVDAQKALNKELDQSVKSQRDLTRATLQSSQANLDASKQRRATLTDQIKKAESDVAAAREAAAINAGGTGGAAGGASQAQLADALLKLRTLQTELARLDQSISESTLAVGKAQAGLARLNVDAELDPKAAAQKKYDIALNKLNIRLTVEPGKTRTIPNLESDGKTWTNETVTGISQAEYAREYRRIKAQLERDLKAAEALNRISNAETGREVTPEEAANIARAAGLQVNSTSRTYAEQKRLYDAWVANGRPADNPVAPPGTSAHEGAKGRWALDIQLANGVTPELLRKVFAAQGVTLTKVFKERGHYHIEGSRSQADAGAAAEDKAAEEATRRQKAYEDQLAQLDSGLLAAKRANLNDADDIAQAEKDQIAVEQQKTEADIRAKVILGDLTETQGKILIERSKQLADEKTITVNTEVLARHLQDATDAQIAASSNRLDLLNAEQSLATTVAQRRDLALAILAEEEKQAKIKAQETIDLFALGKATKEQADEARATLANIDKLHPLKVESINRQNVGALGKYLQDTDPKTINDRVETLVTNELTQVRDGIDDAITNALGVKDPLLKGLLELFLDEVIFRPIAEVLQKRQGKGGAGGFGNALTSLFGGAANDNPLKAANDAAITSNTTALGVSTSAIGAFTTALAAATAAASAQGASGVGGGLGSILGSLGGLGGAGAGVGEYGGVIMENPFVVGGFAGGTSDLPRGLSWVGENGRELLFNHGGGRISVLNNQRARDMGPPSAVGGGHYATTIVNINSPQPSNPRRIGTVVAATAQRAAGRAARKGLAAPRSSR